MVRAAKGKSSVVVGVRDVRHSTRLHSTHTTQLEQERGRAQELAGALATAHSAVDVHAGQARRDEGQAASASTVREAARLEEAAAALSRREAKLRRWSLPNALQDQASVLETQTLTLRYDLTVLTHSTYNCHCHH